MIMGLTKLRLPYESEVAFVGLRLSSRLLEQGRKMTQVDTMARYMTEITNVPFVERRKRDASPDGQERRQFGNTYSELSPRAKELAEAVDQYKLLHRRRYVTADELLSVIESLGYRRSN